MAQKKNKPRGLQQYFRSKSSAKKRSLNKENRIAKKSIEKKSARGIPPPEETKQFRWSLDRNSMQIEK